MRISTNTFYEVGVARINELQTGLVKTQQQIATGRRVLSPADDPIASARALELSQGKSVNEQFAVNRQNARSALQQEEGVLMSVTSLIQDVQELVVKAGNGALDDGQRKYLAIELKGRFEDLLGLANSRDGAGNYMFSGYRVNTPAFHATQQGASYNGDQGQRMLQVGAGRQIALSDSGADVFERVRTGNGTFETRADPANQGSGIAGLGAVTDQEALTHHDYRIAFRVSNGMTTYDIIDTSAGPQVVSTGNRYVSGQSISFHGLQFEIRGEPSDGDSFTVQPSRQESVFTTLHNLIDVLGQSAAGAAAQARHTAATMHAGAELSSMLDNVLTVRASLGARLQEIDSLDSAGSQRDVQYAQTLSELQDVDYAKAISRLSQQQIILEAAQKSFATVSSLSLFKII